MIFGGELERYVQARAPEAADSRLIHTRRLTIAGEVKTVRYYAIQNTEKLQAACDLVSDRYAWRGYGRGHTIPAGGDRTTFTAEMDGRVVGTITLGLDSEDGLLIDNTFREHADEARAAPGAVLAELLKLAFDPAARSMEAMAGLFHIVFIYGTSISDGTDLFIEVRPRHVSFYEAMLGFERCGPPKYHAGPKAEMQLMRLKVDVVRARIEAEAGQLDPARSRSLYAAFFTKAQESQIRRSLTLSDDLRRIELGLRPKRRAEEVADREPVETLAGSRLTNDAKGRAARRAA